MYWPKRPNYRISSCTSNPNSYSLCISPIRVNVTHTSNVKYVEIKGFIPWT